MGVIDEAEDYLLNLAPHIKARKAAVLIRGLLEEIEKRDAVIEATHNILEFSYNWSVHESNKLSDKALEQALKEKSDE